MQKYELEGFPEHYIACGIDNISEMLKNGAYHRYFQGDKDENLAYLKAEWRDYLGKIFRAALLIETYWPDSDSYLLHELNYTKSSILYTLKKYGVEPHFLGLLDKAQVDENRIKSDSQSPLDRNLKENVCFQNKVRPLAEKGRTYCDVRFWGYDLDGKLGVPSQLIVKAPSEGW